MKTFLLCVIFFVLSCSILSHAQILVRETARQDYINNYTGSSFTSVDVAWNGNVATCNAGTISATVLNRTAQRINYFRRMVGVEAMVVLESSRNAKCQQAALMMSANSDLNHNPPNTWTCWSTSGDEAAGNSNLAFGDPTVDIYIEDSGGGNVDVGHRRFVLHSRAKTFGFGLVTSPDYQALWVIGNEGNPPVYNNFVAYPPAGYIPKDLVFTRWSFSHPNANFASASVTMTGPSGNVPLSVISRTAGFADPTIVWEPTGIDKTNSQDVPYMVTVSGITGAPQSTYTYTATIFDPSVGGPPCHGPVVFLNAGPITGTWRSSDYITVDGQRVVDGYAVLSASEINFFNGFEVPLGNCFLATPEGCAYNGTLICGKGDCNMPYRLVCGDEFAGNNADGTDNWQSYGLLFPYTAPENVHTLSIPANSNATVTMSGLNADLDLFGSNTCSNIISVQSINTGNGNETISLNNSSGSTTTFYIIVDGYQGATSNYTLSCSIP